MAENKTYSHNDIKRYLQQQMSQQEMYAFEKALMNDPFLSDALDGYRQAEWNKAANHLSTIEKEITQTKSYNSAAPIIPKKNNWWRVAATIIFIVTGGMITYFVLNKSSTESSVVNSIAVNKTPITIPNDTIKSTEPDLAANSIVENEIAENKKLSAPMLSKENDAPVARLDKAKSSSLNNTPTPGIAATENLKAIESIQDNVDETKKPTAAAAMNSTLSKEFKGQVITNEGEPVPFAIVKVENENIATSTDANGNFSLTTKDSIAKVDVSSAGYATANARIKSNGTINKITINQNNSSLSEVVVTSSSTKKRKNVSANDSKVVTMLSDAAPVPINGWNVYNEYLRKQADSTLQADGKTHSNLKVEVEFSVNKKGEPIKLKSQSNVDKYYIKKAIYIITKGPLWNNYNSNNKALVTIIF